MRRNMAMTVCCNYHIEHQSRHSVMLLGFRHARRVSSSAETFCANGSESMFKGVVEANVVKEEMDGPCLLHVLLR